MKNLNLWKSICWLFNGKLQYFFYKYQLLLYVVYESVQFKVCSNLTEGIEKYLHGFSR